MNNEIKVSLTITLPGRVMFSKEECLKTTQKVIERKTKTGKVYKKTIEVQVEDWDKMDKNTVKVRTGYNKTESLTFYTRKSIPATQSINLYKDTYKYMTSKECPEWSKPKEWGQMNSKKRLEAHLQRIAEYLGGTSYTYQVFED